MRESITEELKSVWSGRGLGYVRERCEVRLEKQAGVDGGQLGMKKLRVHPEGEEMMPTLSTLPQLKPGTPLPSPEDLRGKILIKNKKNQFSGSASPSTEQPSGEAEGSCPPSGPVGGDTGESAWEEWG